jgi:methylenetetrahydrofolate dehydrogenase (NADP+)/methenyltetrahydrofolate cyclohydrolase
MELLKAYNIDPSGKNVVVIGRSILVGKPMVNLMVNANATVTLCHSKTVDIEKITRKADILVVAIGKPNYVTKNMVKRGAIVIDVGINRVDDKLVGDVDYNDVYSKVKLITPVPGGVGPMTVIMLMKNVYKAYLKTRK